MLISALSQLEAEIRTLDTEIARRAKENEVARRLMTVPGIGPLIATAIATLAPSPRLSATLVILRPGSGSHHDNIPLAANSGSEPRRRWANDPCGAC